MSKLTLRGTTWHLRMRVPKRYSNIEARGEIHRSLLTDSEREARIRLPTAVAAILAELDAKLAISGGVGNGDIYSAAVALASSRGLMYRPVADLANGPLEDILSRLDAMKPGDDVSVSKALLGGIDAPKLLVSGLLDEVERINTHQNRFKSLSQMRLWRNPRKRAVANLIAALGEDRPIMEIDVATALRHKAWWQRRIANEKQKADTANKDFSNMASMLSSYYDSLQLLEVPRPYFGVKIKDRHATKKRKLEMPVAWIEEKWLAKGAFDGLNAEARDILLISIETGCRQTEIHDLPASAIILDHAIPHIEVAFEEGDFRREVKNIASVRQVPLVGLALAAAKRHPNGFPRYRDKQSYSALVNKYLRNNQLVPSEKHTVGGVRHTWESRLKMIGLKSDDRGEMMGHSVSAARDREHYGDDMLLSAKRDLALRIALPVPDHLA